MPKSKKPRKKGRHGVKNAAVKKIIRLGGAGRNVDAPLKAYVESHDDEAEGFYKLKSMIRFSNRGLFLEEMTKAMFDVKRLRTGGTEEFRSVTSCLGVGGSLLFAIDFDEETREVYRKGIADAFFDVVRVRSCRNRRRHVSPALIENIEGGLVLAQELLLWAHEHDRQALVKVFRLARGDIIANHPELNIAKEKALLGRHYDRCYEISLEDDLWLHEHGYEPIVATH